MEHNNTCHSASSLPNPTECTYVCLLVICISFHQCHTHLLVKPKLTNYHINHMLKSLIQAWQFSKPHTSKLFIHLSSQLEDMQNVHVHQSCKFSKAVRTLAAVVINLWVDFCPHWPWMSINLTRLAMLFFQICICIKIKKLIFILC